MTARLARIAVVILAAATLSSCWLVWASTFPEFTSLIETQLRLDDYIAADRSAEYRVACYDDGTTEYVFLLVRGSSVGERLLIFDEQLALVHAVTDTPAEDRFAVGAPIATTPGGEVYVGLLAFPPGLGTPATLTANNLEFEHTLYDSLVDELIAVATSGSQLDFITVPSTPDAVAVPDTMAINLAGGDYPTVRTAYSLRAGIAALATADTTNGVVAGFRGPVDTIRSQNISTGSELISNPGGYTFPVTVPIGTVHPVPDGVVVEYEDDGVYLVYHDFQGTQGPELYHDRTDVRPAFSMAGDHFYVLDRERNTLMKVRTWW